MFQVGLRINKLQACIVFRCAACEHCVSAELSSGCLGILEKQYVTFLFSTKYAELSFVCSYFNEIRTVTENFVINRIYFVLSQLILNGRSI